MDNDDVERVALAILNSDRVAAGWPEVESRERIADSDGYVRNARAAIAAMGGANKAVIEQRTVAEWLIWEADESVHSVPETLRALGLVAPEPTT